jgi:hypothetical protein
LVKGRVSLLEGRSLDYNKIYAYKFITTIEEAAP